MKKDPKGKQSIKRIGGYLHRLSPVLDSTGKVVSYVTTPLMVELKPRDIMQIIVGASILAIPVGFTEETWNLGERLPFSNILALAIVSCVCIALFVYFNFYRFQLKGYVFEYIKRVIAIYVLALIVAFPSSMSAAISDTLK